MACNLTVYRHKDRRNCRSRIHHFTFCWRFVFCNWLKESVLQRETMMSYLSKSTYAKWNKILMDSALKVCGLLLDSILAFAFLFLYLVVPLTVIIYFSALENLVIESIFHKQFWFICGIETFTQSTLKLWQSVLIEFWEIPLSDKISSKKDLRRSSGT